MAESVFPGGESKGEIFFALTELFTLYILVPITESSLWRILSGLILVSSSFYRCEIGVQ